MFFSSKVDVVLCFVLIVYSVNCVPVPDEKKDKESKSSEDKSNDNDLGTVSPEEIEKLKEEIIEKQEEIVEEYGIGLTNSPEEIEKYLKKEEKEFGTDLPEKIEESITEGGGDIDNFVHYAVLFDKIKTEANHPDEEVIVEKSPAEMQEMKEESFKLTNEYWGKLGRKTSREDFDRVWDKYKEDYGRLFPYKVEQMNTLLKKEIKLMDDIEVLVSEAAIETTTEMEKEEPPKNVFALENSKGKICILAKFHAMITITYEGKSTEQKFELKMPHTAHVNGKCAGPHQSPELHLSWEHFSLKFFFEKVSNESWSVSSVELDYDTSEHIFDETANRHKVSAKNKKENLFETPLGKSYFCPAEEVILLFSEDKQVAVARLRDLHLQPYKVEDGKFSTSYRCDKVAIDAEPYVQDETVPLAVGSTLAIITLIILVALSIHRAYTAARADYNDMDV